MVGVVVVVGKVLLSSSEDLVYVDVRWKLGGCGCRMVLILLRFVWCMVDVKEDRSGCRVVLWLYRRYG